MNNALFDLSQKCRTWLVENPGPDGRKKIAAHLEQLLTDQDAIDSLVPITAGERDLLYQDPDLGFCILAHNYPGPKTAPPHDHGPSMHKCAAKLKCVNMILYNKPPMTHPARSL